MNKAEFVYSEELLKYRFSQEHPFNQYRLKITLDLLQKSNLIEEHHIISPRIENDEE